MNLTGHVVIPEKSVIGFCLWCVFAQCQACPPINRPPPSATKSCSSSTCSSVYAVHTNTLKSFLNFVSVQFKPDLMKRLKASLRSGETPMTPFRSSSNQLMALFQTGAKIWKKVQFTKYLLYNSNSHVVIIY